jgi:hypothetical protein
MYHNYSRPNTLDELSYQYEVTSALKNIVKTGNVLLLSSLDPAFVVLWACWHWQNFCCYCNGEGDIRS